MIYRKRGRQIAGAVKREGKTRLSNLSAMFGSQLVVQLNTKGDTVFLKFK